jgi:hypothetical protein
VVRIKSALCLWQAENEYQRARNQELVKLQEDSSIRQEQARRATEEQIQAQRRQTEREKAEIERETIRVRAMAEAEGRAHEAKLAEDINRRMLVDRANAEREKWVAAINTTFDHIGGMNLVILFDLYKKDLFSLFGSLFYPLGIIYQNGQIAFFPLSQPYMEFCLYLQKPNHITSFCGVVNQSSLIVGFLFLTQPHLDIYV